MTKRGVEVGLSLPANKAEYHRQMLHASEY